MKLTVIGGGGSRSAFLAKSLAFNANRVHLTEVVFQDISQDNLSLLGELARYVFNAIRPDIRFRLTTDPIDALNQADYIITTIRQDGDEGRVHDEKTALRLNAIGQETTGPGGFAMAMRSVPALLHYCRLIETHASPNAILFNFTNPSGLATEAVIKSGFQRRVYGMCDAASSLMSKLAPLLGCEGRDLHPTCYGLNHLSWFSNITLNGRPVLDKLLSMPDLYTKTPMQYFSPDLLRFCDNQLPNTYLYYYYYKEEALAALQAAEETRGALIARLNKEMREEMRGIDPAKAPQQAFDIWMKHYIRRENASMQSETKQKKGCTRAPMTLQRFIEGPDSGGYAEAALDILEAVNSQGTKRIVVSMPNNGTLDFLQPDDVIEISCDLSADGVKPVPPSFIPVAQKNMIACVKAYERLSVEAILTRSRDLAVRALMAHPLAGSWNLSTRLIDAYLADSRHQDWT